MDKYECRAMIQIAQRTCIVELVCRDDMGFCVTMTVTRTAACFLMAVAVAAAGFGSAGWAAEPRQAYASIAELPDWRGVWVPNVNRQDAEAKANPPSWTPHAAAELARVRVTAEVGESSLFANCLPLGMPAFMLNTHNAIEFLFTPGRVTVLGESDGNRLRRIYTDGRPLPSDPDPSSHGYSVGHWEGDTLVVETTGVTPQAYITELETTGVPNNGDMKILERIRIVENTIKEADTLEDILTITAPHVLSRPWTTRRLFHRNHVADADIAEGVCLQGNFAEATDSNGFSRFVPLTREGAALPPWAPGGPANK